MLTREQILATTDLRTETVEVPEWGGAIRIREMSARRRSEFEKLAAEQGDDYAVAWLVAESCVDEAGQRVFTQEDLEALREKSAAALLRVFHAAAQINNLGNLDQQVKNSEPTPGEGSSSS